MPGHYMYVITWIKIKPQDLCTTSLQYIHMHLMLGADIPHQLLVQILWFYYICSKEKPKKSYFTHF